MRAGLCLTLIVLALAVPVLAQDKPEPAWKGAFGLSYVATSGNSDTTALGLDFGLTRKPEPWGLELKAAFIRAEQNGSTTAERYGASLRGKRALGERWEVFASAGADRDKFAGYDLRAMLAAGATYKALLGPQHLLSFDAGLTWTREEFADVWMVPPGERVEVPSTSDKGALLGLNYAWQIAATSKLTEGLVWYPNFDVSNHWRAVSETALQAALSSRLALKLGYLVRYDHQPPASSFDGQGRPVGFLKTTDTTTTASVVLTF